MKDYKLSRIEAAKMLEYNELRFANKMLGGFVGIAFMWKFWYLNSYAQKLHSMFKKPWGKIPIPAFFFCCGYIGGTQLRARILGSWLPIDNQWYTGDSEILSKFREQEGAKETHQLSKNKWDVIDYLINTTDIT